MLRIGFIGDISLNDAYRDLYSSGINPFQEIQTYTSKFDLVVGNLECISEGNEGENTLKRPRLKTNTDTLNYLNHINVKVVSLAHNHIYDNLSDGFLKTTEFLKNKGIQYLGAGESQDLASKPVILEKDGLKIGLLNFITQDTNPKLPVDSKIYLNFWDFEKIKKSIDQLKQQVNHIVILMHWGGNVEGGLYPGWDQPTQARKLIDAGADLIVGHHSHTVQPHEVYKGKHIFYSIGNFCFSDIWSDGKFFKISNSQMEGLIVGVTFTPAECIMNIQWLTNDKLIIRASKPNTLLLVFRKLIFNLIFLNKYFWKLYYLKNKHLRPFFDFLFRQDIGISQKIKRILSSAARRSPIIKNTK